MHALTRQALDRLKDAQSNTCGRCCFAQDYFLEDVIEATNWRPPVGGGGGRAQARKRHFLRHLHIKINILPRQARDNHRENSKKVPFSLSFQPVAAALEVRRRQRVAVLWAGAAAG